ncbi:lytic transglycosylase domain-containing protein [Microbacterium sp. CJ88]|uniref:aggregation-promoting factor C-terminal-like domain-containing protein n=1 Tax=Microbacterium sp. CJ88 TaxID=3445672 RepID=UPI003F65A398
MRSLTSSTPVRAANRRIRRDTERRARRRPAVVAAGLALGVMATVGFVGTVPVSGATASGSAGPAFALASFSTLSQPAAATMPATVTGTDAAAALVSAQAVITAAGTITSDIAASGLDIGTTDTTVDTSALQTAAARLADGAQHLPAPLVPDLTTQVSAAADTVAQRVASLRGSLDAAVAVKAQQEAEAKAQQAAAAAAAAAKSSSSSSSSGSSSSTPFAAVPTGGGSGDNSPAGAQASAYAMFPSYGWGEDQFGCLVALWNKESGWNYQSYNSSSGAGGIPQALPASKMASAGADWQTNAATQVAWGLGYVAGRYGTPCNAWSHSQSTGWY